MASNAPSRRYANWLARAVYQVEHLRLQLKVSCPWSAGIPAPSSVAPVRRVDQNNRFHLLQKKKEAPITAAQTAKEIQPRAVVSALAFRTVNNHRESSRKRAFKRAKESI